MSLKCPMRAALTGLILILPGQAAADGSAEPAVVKSRVDQVLAYSDQARVYRQASLKLGSGEKTVELASLPAVALAGSLRVESKTATVIRTQLVTDRRRVLPRQGEAKKLLASIEKLLDRRRDLDAERQVLQAELRFLDSLTLASADPDDDARSRRREPEGIFSAAWAGVLGWLDARGTKINARLVALAELRRALAKELYASVVAAKPLDLGAVGRAATRVVATLKGSPGRHRVMVSYLVPSVRWVPSYDLRYDPVRRKVEAVYYALVSQSTGEDWDGARLRFSTDMPTRLLSIPELPTWTLGRKRDFHPTPNRRMEPSPAPWRPGPMPVVHDPIISWVQQALAQARGNMPTSGKRGGRNMDDLLEGTVGGLRSEVSTPMPITEPKPRPRASYKKFKRAQKVSYGDADGAAPPAPPAADSVVTQSAERTSSQRYSFGGGRVRGGSAPSKPTEQVAWSDSGYRPPHIDPDLPAASAEGYRFTLYAAGKHMVPTTGKPRRVPLLTRSFSVEPVYRISPGRGPWAYLMATVKNGTGRPILRGKAHLFSGSMFRGKSWLNTALPGHTLDLPLGVDDAVKVARNQKQRTVAKGVVFKDDVTEYTVTVEIANNHAYPITVDLRDQVPLKRGEKIEIKGFTSTPAMTKPDDEGRVRWKGTVSARTVKKVRFTFQIVRPKDWELRQHNG